MQGRSGQIHYIYDSKETRFSIQNYIGYEVDDAMKILLEQCPAEVDSNHEIHTHFFNSFIRLICQNIGGKSKELP